MAQNNKIIGSLGALGTILCLLFLPASVGATAYPPHRAQSDARYLPDSLFDGVACSMLAIDLDNGDTLYSASPRQNLTPASCMKAVTTGLGFLQLGSDFQFSTTLAYTGTIARDTLFGNLLVIGGGDPSLGSDLFPGQREDTLFSAITNLLQQQRIRYITGNLVADASHFSDSPVHQAWNWEDIGNGYGTGVHGLNFGENKCVVTVDYRPDGTIAVQWPDWFYRLGFSYRIDQQPLRQIDNPSVTLFSAPGSSEYTLTTRLPHQPQRYSVEAAITQPARLLLHQLSDWLLQSGIAYGGTLRMAEPADRAEATPMQPFFSPPYSAVAAKTNELSHNVMADAICKTIGLKTTGIGTFASGAFVMDSLLRSALPESPPFRMLDGSGLARANALSAAFFCHFLSMMYKSSCFDSYYQSLSGVDTPAYASFLRNIGTRTTLRVKSGSMTGVRCYVGYVRRKSGRMVAFAWMLNGYTGNGSDAKAAVENWLRHLIEQ
ncbi:MAG: D-alanyl-D-alanine carboxypeptidase/D-alanyl-D-alanine-endopeptidase [Bacteroidales bacterium]